MQKCNNFGTQVIKVEYGERNMSKSEELRIFRMKYSDNFQISLGKQKIKVF